MRSGNDREYVGCYTDDKSRDFQHGPKQHGYDQDSCHDACSEYLYFALQDNGWCSCDHYNITEDLLEIKRKKKNISPKINFTKNFTKNKLKKNTLLFSPQISPNPQSL